jgi:hypothetical protein
MASVIGGWQTLGPLLARSAFTDGNKASYAKSGIISQGTKSYHLLRL